MFACDTVMEWVNLKGEESGKVAIGLESLLLGCMKKLGIVK